MPLEILAIFGKFIYINITGNEKRKFAYCYTEFKFSNI